MSQSAKIPPMLEGFAVGAPMSSRDGVRCCPAIRENSDCRYLVKIISVPASQSVVDALLLVKAYREPADALEYFKEQADGILSEAAFLQNLSQQGGFLAYEAWDAVPMNPPEVGYNVYLLGSYQRSLAKQMQRNPLTHLDAVNLGLDLCAALSACRKAGRICIDLKPENIFVTREKRYQIGDIGFASIDSLCTTSLPARYCSPYLPPEVCDLLATINDTVDTYAVGMILYQIFNGGKLPERNSSDDAAIPAPGYADEDMAQILVRACSENPQERWNDPAAMGQAIADYLQCHTVNDTPIVPDSTVQVPEESAPFSDSGVEEITQTAAEEHSEKRDLRAAEAWEIVSEGESDPENVILGSTGVADTDLPPDVPDFPDSDQIATESTDDFLQSAVAENDTVQGKNDLNLLQEKASDDFSDELAELHQLLQDSPTREETAPQISAADTANDAPTPPDSKEHEKESGTRKLLTTLAIFLLLAALILGGYVYYRAFYLLQIDSLQITGSQDQITVSVAASGNESSLIIACTDIYGKKFTAVPENGIVIFDGLASGSLYKIQVEANGFHKLTGEVSGVYTTTPVTEISGISCITGSESGSVLLSLTATGNEPASWLLTATADGEETVTQEFTGHSVTAKGLTVGKNYTFQISAPYETQLAGSTSVEFTPCELILAQNLAVTAHDESSFTIRWDSGDAEVSAWTVRCFGGNYDESVETTENEVTFAHTDVSTAYTVDITAEGMSQSSRIQISANPINITDFQVTENTDGGTLQLSWKYSGSVPQGGWTLTYSIDGYSVQETIDTQTAYAEISTFIPNATYSILIGTPDDVSVFQNLREYTTTAANVYTGHGISGYKITAKSLVTPAEQNWAASSVSSDSYTSSFAVGESISLVLQGSVNFYLDDEDLSVMYVIRDKDGNAIPSLVGIETKNWHDLWAGVNYHFCKLTVPTAPTSAGEYTIEVYFNGQSVVSVPITIA